MRLGSRKTASLEPVRVMGTSLVVTPVTGATASNVSVSSASSSGGWIEAVDAVRMTDGFDTNRGFIAARASKQPELNRARCIPNLFQHDNSIDLYEQIDTLLREKSMLIAIV